MKQVWIGATAQMVHVKSPQGEATGTTVERCLAQILPQAPPAMLHGASEILESLLGPLDHGEVHTGVVDA